MMRKYADLEQRPRLEKENEFQKKSSRLRPGSVKLLFKEQKFG